MLEFYSVHFKIRGGQTIHIGGVWLHFVYLVKSNGFFSATRVVVQTMVSLLRRGVEIRRVPSRNDGVPPSLRGAPRQWDMTIRNLIDLHVLHANEHTQFNLIEAHARLGSIIHRSGNRPSEARVSILIPAYNNAAELATCLESIFSFPASADFAVIIGDDASPDVDLRVFGGFPGVRVVRHPRNLGYVNNVNTIARLASTEFIVTLNQDTLVLPGWVDELISEFEQTSNCGAVGPRILDSEFRILEAGGLLFQNAEAAHRGRGSHADDPRLNYSAHVDYVSGCALLTRKDVWQQLGGLDEDLAPAYYDDVDYCLRLANLGLAVRYAPLSCVIHFEGTSMGKSEFDTSSLKRFQSVNRQKLTIKYPSLATRTSMADRPWPDSHSPDSLQAVCILENVPNPLRDGGAVDFTLFIEYLLELKFQVSLLFTSRVEDRDTNDWRALGVRCAQIDDAIALDLIERATAVISFGTMVGVELNRREFSHAHWIHHTSDCATRRLEQMIEIQKDSPVMSHESLRWYAGLPRDPEAMWQIERQTIERPTVGLLVSREDLDYCRKRGATGNLQVFPIMKGFSGPIDHTQLPPTHPTVSFVGSFFHSPNPDAVDYFLTDIWPLVLQRIPKAQFLIWGSNISSKKSKEWSLFPNVQTRGWFSEWGDVIAETRTFVSPLRFGAGMKHKVIHSILLGRPVIGTHNSFDGLDKSLLHPAFVSDDPRTLAELLVGSLTSPVRWTEALQLGLRAIGTSFYRSSERDRVSRLIRSVTS